MALSPLKSSTSVIGKLFGNAVSSAVGFGAGVAMAPVLGPVVRDISNSVNSHYSFVFPEPGTLASGVSQGQIDRDTAGRWASYAGVGDKAFQKLVDIANTGPGVPVAFDLWRRNVIDEPSFRRAAKRQGLEQEWIDDLVKLKEELLDPAQTAAAIHRNIIPDPGLLVGDQPGPDRKVPIFPKVPIDALKEAAGQGLDEDRLRVLVGLQGLPMGPHEAAEAYFRQIITHDDFLAAIAQGNTRNEWAEAIVEQTRQIPTARDFLENALRGYHDQAWATEQAARHGMSAADALVIYQNQGRPMNIHQITQALAWGATFHPEPGELTDPYHASIVEGPVKPAYYEMAESLKYNLPSALYFRVLQQNKVLTPAQAETWYLRLGWPPELAQQVSQAFGKAQGGATKEATVTDLLTLWDGGKLTAAETHAAIVDLDYPADEAQRKMDVVAARRVIGAKQAAIGDLHTAFKKGDLDTLNATNALLALGEDQATAAAMVSNWQQYVTAVATAPTPPPV